MQEEWRPILGHDGYEVSNLGRVRSVDRVLLQKDAHGGVAKFHYHGRILTQVPTTGGYMCVSLDRGNGIFRVHRLVALAFIPKEEGRPMINHKDGDPSNNRVDNLEWCDNRENQLHACRVLGKNLKRNKRKRIKCVETGEIFDCSIEAAKGNRATANNIRAVANKCYGRKTCLGYHWEFIS